METIWNLIAGSKSKIWKKQMLPLVRENLSLTSYATQKPSKKNFILEAKKQMLKKYYTLWTQSRSSNEN